MCILQVEDATVAKYLDMGHNKEAIQYALQTYGDDQTKVGSYYSLYGGIFQEAQVEATSLR